MFDPTQKLFCYRLKQTPQGMIQEGISHRYTIITLLGLFEYERTGGKSPIPVRETFCELLKRQDWLTNVGDLGLLLWLYALAAPDRLYRAYQNLNVATAFSRYREVRERRTMELAWLLTGLSYSWMVLKMRTSDVRCLATQTYELLKKNQGSHGLFGHSAQTGSLAGFVRGSIGSFADQVYPIYGMTRFAQAFEVDEALERAMNCAVAICKAQGPLGQWWWQYDSITGRVAQRYPVYSVHQVGMAPMALFAVGEATDCDFSVPIYRGLQWITGNNELHADMRDPAHSLIWRCVQPAKKLEMYLNEILRFLKFARELRVQDGLAILFEGRPYELGWLLYAFASQENQQTMPIIVR
jgi:hypothetical protein